MEFTLPLDQASTTPQRRFLLASKLSIDAEIKDYFVFEPFLMFLELFFCDVKIVGAIFAEIFFRASAASVPALAGRKNNFRKD